MKKTNKQIVLERYPNAQLLKIAHNGYFINDRHDRNPNKLCRLTGFYREPASAWEELAKDILEREN